MPAVDFSMDAINDYFSTLNPIAAKICEDINETKSAYENIFWDKLNASEQMEIINETLIKPEISLRYFDNFSTSTCSLASILFTNGDATAKTTTPQPTKLKATKIYNFDGKHLQTYASHKTGVKIIHDDTVGCDFRDEHSTPFSYKTRSQINLLLFADQDLLQLQQQPSSLMTRSAAEVELPPAVAVVAASAAASADDNAPTNDSLQTYQKVQNELANSIIISNKAKSKYERFYNETTTTTTAAVAKPSVEAVGDFKPPEDASSTPKSGNFLSKFMAKSKTATNCKNLDIEEYYEGLNLMQNISYSGLTSSSSVPSEEEETEEYKTVCEDSRLLLDSDDLSKGFDFLNNW